MSRLNPRHVSSGWFIQALFRSPDATLDQLWWVENGYRVRRWTSGLDAPSHSKHSHRWAGVLVPPGKDEARLVREDHRLDAVAQLELHEDVGDVRLHSR